MPSDTNFNEICYLARYPDLVTMYQDADGSWHYGNPSNRTKKQLHDPGNAFWHWQNFGIAEGRVPGCDLPGTIYSALFNSAAYLARYPDVRGTALINSKYASNPELHYQTIGIGQGRHPGYEVITSATFSGVVSPGTTTNVPDDPTLLNNAPGDGTVLPSLNPTDPVVTTPPAGTIDPTTGLPVVVDPVTGLPVTSTTTTTGTGISAWITANPMEAVAIGLGLLLILTKKKHKNRA